MPRPTLPPGRPAPTCLYMHDAIMKIDKRRVLQIVELGSPTADQTFVDDFKTVKRFFFTNISQSIGIPASGG